MAAYTTPLSMPRRQTALASNPDRLQSQNNQDQQQPDQEQLPKQRSNPSSNASSSPSLPSSSSIPRGSTFTSSTTTTTNSTTQRSKTLSAPSTGGTTLVPGRKLQYQLPLSSRLENNNHVSPLQQYQFQQPGSSSSSTNALSNNPNSVNTKNAGAGQRLTSSNLATLGSTSLFPNQPYRQIQPVRNDNGVGSSRANMANTQNTQTTMMTTATTTTNQTGMTDKPKTRKKDKPPKIPPPEQIYDINGKSYYTRGPALGEVKLFHTISLPPVCSISVRHLVLSAHGFRFKFIFLY